MDEFFNFYSIDTTIRASAFLRTEHLAYGTKPYYIGTPKKSSFCQKLFDLPKVRFGTVREKVDARSVLCIDECINRRIHGCIKSIYRCFFKTTT
jgi:hypothetical protein